MADRPPILHRLRAAVARLRDEVQVYVLAARDPRTPWLARAVVVLVVAYALSPIDLIPDPIPVLGLLDDVLLIPIGLRIARALIPDAVLRDCRERVASGEPGGARTRLALVVVPITWLVLLIVVAWIAWR